MPLSRSFPCQKRPSIAATRIVANPAVVLVVELALGRVTMHPAVETKPSTITEAPSSTDLRILFGAGIVLKQRSDAVGFGVFDRLCAGCLRGLAGID